MTQYWYLCEYSLKMTQYWYLCEYSLIIKQYICTYIQYIMSPKEQR